LHRPAPDRNSAGADAAHQRGRSAAREDARGVAGAPGVRRRADAVAKEARLAPRRPPRRTGDRGPRHRRRPLPPDVRAVPRRRRICRAGHAVQGSRRRVDRADPTSRSRARARLRPGGGSAVAMRLALLALAACGSLKDPGTVADKFVDKYYVESDQDSALAFTTAVATMPL